MDEPSDLRANAALERIQDPLIADIDGPVRDGYEFGLNRPFRQYLSLISSFVLLTTLSWVCCAYNVLLLVLYGQNVSMNSKIWTYSSCGVGSVLPVVYFYHLHYWDEVYVKGTWSVSAVMSLAGLYASSTIKGEATVIQLFRFSFCALIAAQLGFILFVRVETGRRLIPTLWFLLSSMEKLAAVAVLVIFPIFADIAIVMIGLNITEL